MPEARNGWELLVESELRDSECFSGKLSAIYGTTEVQKMLSPYEKLHSRPENVTTFVEALPPKSKRCGHRQTGSADEGGVADPAWMGVVTVRQKKEAGLRVPSRPQRGHLQRRQCPAAVGGLAEAAGIEQTSAPL